MRIMFLVFPVTVIMVILVFPETFIICIFVVSETVIMLVLVFPETAKSVSRYTKLSILVFPEKKNSSVSVSQNFDFQEVFPSARQIV